MSSQDLITLVVNAGYEAIDYGDHYCIKRELEVSIVVVIPKVPHLISKLVEKVKVILGL